MTTATAMGNGHGNSNGDGNGNSNRDSDGNGNGNGNGVGNDDGDGNGNHNGDGQGKGDNDEGKVASLYTGNVKRGGRGCTLPPPLWIQRSVHSPALHHGGDTAKSVCSFSRGGGFLTAHHGLFFIFYNYCSVY
jgi:hypothetical protein